MSETPEPTATLPPLEIRYIPRPSIVEVPRKLLLMCRQNPRWAASEIMRLRGDLV